MTASRKLFAVFLPLVLAFAGCNDEPGSPQSGPGGKQSPPALVASGTANIDACSSLGTGGEACSWTWRLDPVKCLGKQCRRLIIFFSGGQMTCPDPTNASAWLDIDRQHGYIAVCARIFTTGGSTSNSVPFHMEASRVDLLVKSITADPNIQNAWTGEYLLFSGVSHGATAPVIAMANTTLDEQPHWKGTKHTGACFLDGVYDVPTIMNLEHDNLCGNINSILSYEREYTRYCSWPGGWPATSTCVNPDTGLDSITSLPPSRYAINDWKLIECGSAMPFCASDVVPAGPIQNLCSQISSDGVHACSLTSAPNTGHVQCSVDSVTVSACTDWFDAQLTAKNLPL